MTLLRHLKVMQRLGWCLHSLATFHITKGVHSQIQMTREATQGLQWLFKNFGGHLGPDLEFRWFTLRYLRMW